MRWLLESGGSIVALGLALDAVRSETINLRLNLTRGILIRGGGGRGGLFPTHFAGSSSGLLLLGLVITKVFTEPLSPPDQ